LSETDKKSPRAMVPRDLLFFAPQIFLSDEPVQCRARPIKGVERYDVSRGCEK
jgi:hypothetical protein